MSYTAKLATETVAQDEFELFTTETATTADGTEVEILKSLGRFRTDQLEAQKANLLNQIAELDEKLAAIEAIQAA